MADAHLLGALHRQGLERVVPHQSGQGSDRSVHRLRSPHPDRLRPGLADGRRRGGQGRGTGGAPRSHAHPARRHPARTDEHVDDHQRHSRVDAGVVRGQRRGSRRRPRRVARYHAERHRQGIPLARHVHLPAGSVAPTHRRHGCVVRQQRAQVEPHERVLVPPSRGRRHAGSGDRVLVGYRGRSSRCRS